MCCGAIQLWLYLVVKWSRSRSGVWCLVVGFWWDWIQWNICFRRSIIDSIALGVGIKYCCGDTVRLFFFTSEEMKCEIPIIWSNQVDMEFTQAQFLSSILWGLTSSQKRLCLEWSFYHSSSSSAQFCQLHGSQIFFWSTLTSLRDTLSPLSLATQTLVPWKS